MIRVILALSILFTSSTVFAQKKVKYRKTQEVNFEGVDVDGNVRSPDGAYLVQKRGVEFLPMYKVRQHFDESIKESMEYVE